MKQFDHYCETLRCKMSKEACLGSPVACLQDRDYRIDAHTVLANHGFYPECYTCVRGRRLARSCGISIGLLRRQMADLRARVRRITLDRLLHLPALSLSNRPGLSDAQWC